ncbi:MAG: lipase family protein [Sphingomonadaceae bacterium]|nr:lipase family protein [Sphingomonadaceae bacterium]
MQSSLPIGVAALVLAALPAAAEPGRLISAAPLKLAGVPEGARGWRIRYETRDERGRAVESTGFVIAPARGGADRPVVAWAHGTWGIAEACAPSLSPAGLSTIPDLAAMVRRGWVVTATDYPGLGTPGPHGYLAGDAAAFAVIDSVRVARQLRGAGAGSSVAFWGHSQGGHAVLFASARQPSYAPELRQVGAVAVSPPAELQDNLEGLADRRARGLLTAYVTRSWSRYYGAPLSAIAKPPTISVIDRATRGCVGQKIGFAQLIRVLALGRSLGRLDLSGDPVWGPLLKRNSAPATGSTPLMLVSAREDAIVADAVTRRYASAACRSGAPVRFVEARTAEHAQTAVVTGTTAERWIADRFAGRAAGRDCSPLR